LEADFRRLLQREIEPGPGQDAASPDAGLLLDMKELGRRPAGATDPTSHLVRSALAATRAVGATPELVSSSTDANVPMALGIPAITLGAGGRAGGIHTTKEWYRNEKGPEGILRALLTLLLASRLDGLIP
jgi:acetylornithine deacetylase/succinyl-diaminopimelate desuccinylase-like protein